MCRASCIGSDLQTLSAPVVIVELHWQRGQGVGDSRLISNMWVRVSFGCVFCDVRYRSSVLLPQVWCTSETPGWHSSCEQPLLWFV